jgi:hypothetical protein
MNISKGGRPPASTQTNFQPLTLCHTVSPDIETPIVPGRRVGMSDGGDPGDGRMRSVAWVGWGMQGGQRRENNYAPVWPKYTPFIHTTAFFLGEYLVTYIIHIGIL